jgi:prophage maintenance system killer protein
MKADYNQLPVHGSKKSLEWSTLGDHPFSDGNKRTRITVCAIFLAHNKIQLHAQPLDLEDFTVRVVTDHLDIDVIAYWLQTNSDRN